MPFLRLKGVVMDTITYDEIHKLFDYDPDTGIFLNRVTRSSNAKKGEVAGGLDISKGYWQIRVNGKKYRAHRLAWLYVYGYFPEYGLDHKDRIRHHNWINNLREASQSCNLKNCKIHSNNISGITGVCWHKRNKKWRVYIRDRNHKPLHIGYFASLLEAAKARYAAELKYKYPDCNTQSSALNYIEQN